MPRNRALWTEEELRAAMEAVQGGMAASSMYEIPPRTLRNHLSIGKTSINIGRPCMLTVNQESDLRDQII